MKLAVKMMSRLYNRADDPYFRVYSGAEPLPATWYSLHPSAFMRPPGFNNYGNLPQLYYCPPADAVLNMALSAMFTVECDVLKVRERTI